jgi:sec-independent protein translocase protein TatB
MSFSDTVFLFFLALILFGPKKLPEMARQAGRLLAELRRASNEFKSQIETEIAHLEVQKNDVEKNAIENKAQEILPPAPAPHGTVASLSSNPAAVDSPHQLESSSAPATSTEAPVAEPVPATSQESHV